jgi:hypothetical protein
MTIDQVLLVLEASIYRQQYVEVRCFCLLQKLTVLESREASIPSGLTVVSRQVMAQLLAYTLIK